MSADTRGTALYPVMSIADYRDHLWIALRQAHEAADSISRRYGSMPTSLVTAARGYRDGLLTAYAMLTEQTEEDVHESLQEAITP